MDNSGHSALHWSASENSLEIAKLLVLRHANVSARTLETSKCSTPLHCIAARENSTPGFIRLLIQAGASSEVADIYETRPLHYTASAGNLEAINERIANGANIESTDGDGWVSLHSAKFNGKPLAIEALLRHGADPLRSNWNFLDRVIKRSCYDGKPSEIHCASNVEKSVSKT